MNKTFVEKAHGRVNLIGEHTDYNGGWVLPTAIKQFTEVTLTKSDSQEVLVLSSADPKSGVHRELKYILGEEKKESTWLDYIQGATKILMDVMKARGQSFNGFKIQIHSNVPEGSGLSSSAALEISVLKALRAAYDLKITDVELARIGQRIENEFVGARVGIMDQMACSLAQDGVALFLDTHQLTYEQIAIPLEEMDVLIINSGISHRLSATGGYNERRAQCEEACKILGIQQLRDITLQNLLKADLPELLMRRARHVVSENERVFAAVSAIKSKDLKKLGELFFESHESMKDDYEVSIPEIDFLVELCRDQEEVFGARLTGGGFGGSIVAITQKGFGNEVGQRVVDGYHKQTPARATILS
jgi:galactokinase